MSVQIVRRTCFSIENTNSQNWLWFSYFICSQGVFTPDARINKAIALHTNLIDRVVENSQRIVQFYWQHTQIKRRFWTNHSDRRRNAFGLLVPSQKSINLAFKKNHLLQGLITPSRYSIRYMYNSKLYTLLYRFRFVSLETETL